MLEQYREKRDFGRTPEPGPASGAPREGPLIFVVQKHAASRLHYDFRLEIGGALKSWPVPKGPSLDPGEKRLAMMVEDHPLDYASFEGVIPKGEYGGGQVIVWDAGTYSPDEDGVLSFGDREEADRRMREGLTKGKLSFFLRGRKMKGSWTLVKTRRAENEWLLIKHRDRFADAARDILTDDRSIIGGLTVDDLKAGHLPDRSRRLIFKPQDLQSARRAALPRKAEPMLAELAERAFSAPGWLFEPKLDGVRTIAVVAGDKVRLLSRKGLDATAQYPSVAEELAAQPEPEVVLDGEIVALGENGAPSFQLLQRRLNLSRDSEIRRAEAAIPVVYYVFDLLHAGGYDLRGAPLAERKALLESLVVPSEHVVLLHHFEESGEDAYDAAVALGFEGIVAKRKDGVYESGRRSRGWLKVKATLEDEFVVGGYSPGAGGRSSTFGALLLGYYDGEGRLAYAGNVGTGFDDRTLGDLRERLDAIRGEECPFAQAPPGNAPVTWARPELVARVRFAQWTSDGRLRSASFLGLREDKPPADVRRQEAVPAPVESGGGRPAAGADEVQSLLEQLENPAEKFALKVGPHKVRLNNMGKELWPALGERRALTKRDLLVYLARVSSCLLLHLRDRPLTLTRYPDGIRGEHFYQKHWDAPLPEFVETVRLWSGHNEADGDYLLCNNLATLMWLGQLADIELHTWYSRVSPEPDGHHLPEEFAGSQENIDASRLNYPDFIVFDLDPYIYSGMEARGAEPELNRKAFAKTCDVALWLKEILDSLSLSSFVKTTGKTGLHIYVPILREFDYDSVRAAAETLGRFLVRAHPRAVTMEWAVSKRTEKVFYDHNQNSRGKTLASVYSPRPSPEAAVSMPLRWDELREVYPPDFTILTAPARLERVGDLWAGILAEKHDLGALLGGAAGDAAMATG